MYPCSFCSDAERDLGSLNTFVAKINERDKHLAKEQIKLTIGYEKESIAQLLPEFVERYNSLLSAKALGDISKVHLDKIFQEDQITLVEKSPSTLILEHISDVCLCFVQGSWVV